MAAPGRVDQFEIWEKTKTVISMTVKDGAGVVLDLTGKAVRFSIALRPGGASHVSKTTGGSGIVITDAVNGEIDITLQVADVTLPNGQVLAEGVQELTIYAGGNPAGDATDQAKGEITIHDLVFETE